MHGTIAENGRNKYKVYWYVTLLKKNFVKLKLLSHFCALQDAHFLL